MKRILFCGLGIVALLLVFFIREYGGSVGGITGAASLVNVGCCEINCQTTTEDACLGQFQRGKKCSTLDQCNIGCCVDKEGYCMSNYLKGNCQRASATFISTSECLQYPLCIKPPVAGSFRGSVGYPLTYPASQKGVVFIEPESGTFGQPFIIKVDVFGNAKRVKARMYEGSYEVEFHLFDDGYHGDGNPDDGVFGGVWQSSEFPSFSGIKRINVVAEVDGVESRPGDYFILTSSRCVPLNKQWDDPASRRDVVFIDLADPQQASTYQTEVTLLLEQMKLAYLDKMKSSNFYTMNDVMYEGDKNVARDKIRDSCLFYDPAQDTTIFFDNTFDYCEQDNDLVRVHPAVFVNKSIVDDGVAYDTFMKNVCQYVITRKKIFDNYASVIQPPNVTLVSPGDDGPLVTAAWEFPISFIVDDMQDGNVTYEIFADINHPLTLMKEGSAERRQLTTTLINLTDGAHDIWVEVTDSDNNFGHSEIRQIIVNQTNFVVDIVSLEPLLYDQSPDINFTISHATDTEIKYALVVDDEVVFKGIADRDKVENIKTGMENGTHTVEIAALDLLERVTYSLPYEITIGQESTETKTEDTP